MDTGSLIPIIDFETCGLHRKTLETQAMVDVGKQMKDAMSSVGFCYLKNHGVEDDVVENYFKISKQFFDLPVEEKMKHVRGEELNFGWVAVERERLNKNRPGDLKEAFNYHPADDPDDWPNEAFQKASKNMFRMCTEVAHRVCDTISVGLGFGTNFMRDAHKFIGAKGNPTTIRSLYYPPVDKMSSIKPGQIRLGEHSDYGSITLLFQDDIGGLEVEIPGKGYVPATPIPGTIVVNLGDLMQRWTADHLIATKHRVLIPEAEFKKRKSRQSVAFFVHPDDDYMVKSLDGSDKYEPITSLDYLNFRFSETY